MNDKQEKQDKQEQAPRKQRRRLLPSGREEVFVHPDLQGGRASAVPRFNDSAFAKKKKTP